VKAKGCERIGAREGRRRSGEGCTVLWGGRGISGGYGRQYRTPQNATANQPHAVTVIWSRPIYTSRPSL
jgi:hypothetical protein